MERIKIRDPQMPDNAYVSIELNHVFIEGDNRFNRSAWSKHEVEKLIAALKVALAELD